MNNVTVIEQGIKWYLSCEEGESIFSALIREDASFGSFCGGNGICGKCKIRCLDGSIPVTEADRRIFTEDELREGCRLSCLAYPKKDCVIELMMRREERMDAVAEYEADCHDKTAENITYADPEFAIAVDLGTTTIAMQLVDKKTGAVLATHTSLNPQRSYGADVISRMQAANTGQGNTLKKLVCDALEQGFESLIKTAEKEADSVSEIIISANTTMNHLLLGYPCETLGVSPFTPYCIDPEEISVRRLIPDSAFHCPVRVIRGISTFVGGDIVSGLYLCDILNQEAPVLFIDLGTNGEMALGNKKKLLVTSVAAGPAFEGGNLSSGVGSIPGAIRSVTVEGKEVKALDTIGGKEPLGICGTGVIETVYELVKEEILDETGLMEEEYFEEGFVLFPKEKGGTIKLTQKDVREIQLAKSAVRAGMEILMKRYGAGCEEIEKVYLAGGFGYHMNVEKMVGIGMLPEEFRGKIKAMGNTSLGGAVKASLNKESREVFETIAGLSKEMNLALDAEFHQLYMEYLEF